MENVKIIRSRWKKKIVEEEQKGEKRAGYGKNLIENLSNELMKEFKKGFDVTNLRRMRRFYLIYLKWETVSPKLTWSHYSELIKIEDELGRSLTKEELWEFEEFLR